MATTYHQLRGKAEWAKVYPGQIDREFESPEKGGNWSIVVEFDNDEFAKYKALGTKARPKGNKVSFRRYERSSFSEQLGSPQVTLPEGVKEGKLIGNGSDVTVGFEVYDYVYQGRPGKGVRLTDVTVNTLVEYVKPEVANGATAQAGDTPPAH